MHLGINVVRLTRTFTGVGRYIESILKEWSRVDVPFDRITLFTNKALEQERLDFPVDQYTQKIIGPQIPDPLWESVWLTRESEDIDVLFGPSYTLPVGYRGRAVVTNHGPADNKFPSFQWWRAQAYEALYRQSTKVADHVLVNSQAVKQRMIKTYRVPEDKLTVTYLAPNEAFRPVDSPEARTKVLERWGLDGSPYILFVGKMAARHYIPNLLGAYARLAAELPDQDRLVLVGPDYLGLDIPTLAATMGIAKQVTYIPYADLKALPALYSAASFFVFPASDAEGFGFPVVEAMACGTPVVTTGLGSLSEIAADAALITGDTSEDALYQGMKKMAFDSALWQDMRVKGLDRAKQFSWQTTARQTMKLLWDTAAR
ncbi:MAG: glycosyltransferase family 1 protein [Pseudomonadota bacterium]